MEPNSSRPVVLNATLLKREVHTRLDLILEVFLDVNLVKLKDLPTLTPTRRRVSFGKTRHCLITWRTPRSTFLVPRWCLTVSRSPKNVVTLLRT